MKLQPVILSGGSGSRLWPLSREHYPKQLLALVGEATMLQATARRLDGLPKVDRSLTPTAPIVVCNVEHRFLIAEQMRQAGKSPAAIILEPVGRNTAPALTIAALAAVAADPDAILMVMPADHIIAHEDVFLRAVATGHGLARDGMLVTFGIVPSNPETGYGYIRKGAAHGNNGAFAIDAFVEKPDAAKAQEYLASGQYYWNSGMFLLRASAWLGAIEQFRPKMAAACRASYERGKKDLDFYRLDLEAFSNCESDSIDYAVMEPIAARAKTIAGVTGAAVVPLDAGWSDIGAWSSLWDARQRDARGNAIDGDVYASDCENSLISSHSRLVAGVGLRDMVVVETSDAVMVAHKDRSQDVKKIVDWLKQNKRPECQTHQRVYRPWGSYESVVDGPRFQVKRIVVNPNAALSLQMHHHRAEHWIVVTGTARVTRGDEVFLLSENQSTYIPLGVTHRLENPGMVPLEMIEVQSGSYLGEDDIVRFDDQYGRSPSAKS
jgi:mannose-1-phosphate guanylyltransferase/mannose-6-phosphate isomerase